MLKEIEGHQHPSIWSHAAYGMIGVFFSYFEMVGKTLNPNSGSSGTAGKDFNYGFCDVYPSLKPSNGNYGDAQVPLVVELRNRVRNGMYHLAYTKNNLMIHNDAGLSGEDFSVLIWISGINYRLRANEMRFRGFSFDSCLRGRRAPA